MKQIRIFTGTYRQRKSHCRKQSIRQDDAISFINQKNRKKDLILSLFTAIIAITFSSCDKSHESMLTTINKDGSCSRQFTDKVDSAFYMNDTTKFPFPVAPDSTWDIIISRKTSEGLQTHIQKFRPGEIANFDSSLTGIVSIRRNYVSVDSMKSQFRFDHSPWISIIPRPSLTKKFKWFYTYYQYKETFPSVNPFKKIPISRYLTNEEIKTYLGEDNRLYSGKNGIEVKKMLSDIEGRCNAWYNRNLYEEYFNLILKYYNRMGKLAVDSATFSNARDTIYKLAGKDSLSIDDIDFMALIKKHFKNLNLTKVKLPEPLEKQVEADFKSMTSYENYFHMDLDYLLLMPGKILETNTQVIKSDTMVWKLTAYRFLINDYTIKALSRTPNSWAFVATLLIIVLAAGGLLVKQRKKE